MQRGSARDRGARGPGIEGRPLAQPPPARTLYGRGTVLFHTRGRRGAHCAPPEDGEERGPERSRAGAGEPRARGIRQVRPAGRRRAGRSRAGCVAGRGEGSRGAARGGFTERGVWKRACATACGGGVKIMRLPDGRALQPPLAKRDRAPCSEVFQLSGKVVNLLPLAARLARHRRFGRSIAAVRPGRPANGGAPTGELIGETAAGEPSGRRGSAHTVCTGDRTGAR